MIKNGRHWEMADYRIPCAKAVNVTDPNALRTCVNRLLQWHRKHGEELYASAPEAIVATAELFLSAGSPYRERALALGPRVGLSPEMVDEALSNALGGITAKRLETLRHSQLRPGRRTIVSRPRLVFHVLAGNLFLSGWESLILATLLGACSIVRTSAVDRWFAPLWLEAMKSVSPLFGETLQCFWWPHEATDLTQVAAEAADAVVAFGDDTSVMSIRQFVAPHKQFIGHGYKISLVVLDAEEIEADTLPTLAKKLAYDFSVYDQQGCLSPRALFVRAGSREVVMRLGAELVRAMRLLSEKLPPDNLSLEEAAALAREREEARIQHAACESNTARQACDAHAYVFSMPEDPFIVVCRSARPFAPSPVNRAVVIRIFSTLTELRELLAPYRGHISTVGVARPSPLWSELARDIGAGRICVVGQMQKPPLGWTHDGLQPLRSLCSFIEIQGLRN